MPRATPASAPALPPLVYEVVTWASARADIAAIALVGSHARGAARPDSDVDLVLLFDDPQPYLEHPNWVGRFADAETITQEDYGPVQSLRVVYGNGLEVEFGLTSLDWAALDRLELGTSQVVADGMRILFDPRGLLVALARAVTGSP
jgi:uncharacterized protein